MSMPQALKRFLHPALMILLGLAGLYIVTLVYATGESLLACVMLVTLACFVWIYTSPKTYAYRYLFPGIGAALIFVVFPMLYTVRIGFTNYSSKNLLTFKRATQYLLEETYRAEGATYNSSLYPEGSRWRLRLEDADSGAAFATDPLDLSAEKHLTLKASPSPASLPGEEMAMKDLIDRQAALKAITVQMPDGALVRMTGLREFAPSRLQYARNPDGSLTNNQDHSVIRPNLKSGFYETSDGEQVQPGFQVDIGWKHYVDILKDPGVREPFGQIFIWTITFAALTVVFATSLGMLLAVLLNWESLRFRSVYRLLLFLPYAIPGFISILVFKGLFNNNLGEINIVLSSLFGIKPAWFSDPFLAKTMILIVNTWLGFPYMMVVCMGLIKAIPQDLYEASAVAGAGPITNFFKITVPLIIKPMTPLLISSFAFNFNNFVLISLLTGGRPDILNTSLSAGTTDILATFTYRIAFEGEGQQFGLAAAISTLIFLMVAVISIVQIRATKITQDDKR
ncbi:maltose ABC transporter permease MalF [Geothrix limicola]|uniref:Maltose/maltodextrin transport system permease protein n=1 Tax=Geothrix limicola TaxID=2927978 RepID=A0ABQ5QEL7_9BACT|nr:maltose ABC transporter permease MalF [Geothrix limicola]GLH73282.1 maltose ABC transporter permease MalF [Geothrix limicola]